MVAELQRMLDDIGYERGPGGRSVGAQTAQALDSFERDRGLPRG